MKINGIDFDERLEILRQELHINITYRFSGFMPMVCLDMGYGAPIVWIKFNDYGLQDVWES